MVRVAISVLLSEPLGGCRYTEALEEQFASCEVLDIAGHDPLRIPGDGQLNEVVVGFVGQVRTPKEGDVDPLAHAEDGVQQVGPVFGPDGRRLEQLLSGKYILVLEKQGITDEWLGPSRQASPENLSGGASRRQDRRNQDVRVDDDPDHDGVTAYTLSRA